MRMRVNNDLETTDYIFLECEWVRKVWFASPLTVNIENIKIKHVHDWLDYMT
jgi:hypothetical protein